MTHIYPLQSFRSGIAVFIVLVSILFGGCSAFKKSQEQPAPMEEAAKDTALKDLPQDKEIEYQYKFIEATKLRLMGRASDALELLTQCSQIQPHAPAPYYQMSLIADQINEQKEAIKYGKKAVQYGPDNKWYRLHLANLYLQQNTTDSALSQYDHLVRKNDVQDLEILFRAAQLYQKNSRYREALQIYNRIEERMGFNEQISILKKMIYTRLGNKEKAYDEVKKLIDKNPDEARYYGMLAETYATFKEYEKADKMYDKLFALDSTNNLGQLSKVKYYNEQEKFGKTIDLLRKEVIPNPSVDFRDKMLMLLNFLSDNQKLTRYTPQVGAALDSMVKYHPDRNEVHAMYADYYLKQNKFSKSIDHLLPLAQSDQGKFVYWDQLLSVYSITSRFDDMYRHGLESLQQYPRKPRLYLLTSIGALQTNKADTAISLLEKGKTLIKEDQALRIQFLTQLGEAYYQEKKYEPAWKHFEEVIRLDPDNVMVLNNYSYYLSLRGENLEKAKKYSRKTIEQEPENAIYLDTYAWILYRKGEIKKARKFIEKAIENGGGDDADVVEHYGDILFEMGEKEKALKQWQKSLELGNASDAIRYKINHKQLPPKTHEE
jgi:tetratricopeptide (TPR) repeat protein